MSLIAAVSLLPLLAAAAGPDPKLASVNGDVITVSDLQKEFTRRHGGHQRFLAGEVEARRFLDLVIDRKLLIQEAERLALQDLPAIAAATRERLGGEAVLLLVKAEIDDKAQPTPAEVRSAWEKHTNEIIQVRQIVLATPEEAEQIRARLVAGESFEALAREHSIAGSRVMGGRLPTIGWGAREPEWEDAVFKLAPNEFSPVIETPEGWEIVQFGSRSPLERPPFEKASARVEAILKKRKLDERKRAFSEQLWTKYNARLTDLDRGPASIGKAAKETPAAPVAVWDGGSLSVLDFMKQLDMKQLASVLPARLPREIDARLREMVNEPLALIEARARGLEQAPAAVAAAKRFQEELMEGALYDGYVLKDVSVGDEEVRAYYDAHAAELVTPEKRQVAHLVVATLEEAQALRKRVGDGEPFEDLVKQYSSDTQTAKSGGDLGLIGRKDVPPEFAPVLALREGEVSEPLQSKFGYHLVRLTKIVPEQALAFDAAKDDIRKSLLQKKHKEKRNAWVAQLRAAATIKVDTAAIRAFVKKSEAQGELTPPAAPSSHGAAGQNPHGGPPR